MNIWMKLLFAATAITLVSLFFLFAIHHPLAAVIASGGTLLVAKCIK
jgi:hypothetical protein